MLRAARSRLRQEETCQSMQPSITIKQRNTTSTRRGIIAKRRGIMKRAIMKLRHIMLTRQAGTITTRGTTWKKQQSSTPSITGTRRKRRAPRDRRSGIPIEVERSLKKASWFVVSSE